MSSYFAGLIITPYALRVLGNVQFGLWAIANVITSYARLSEFGIDRTLTKYIAEYWPKKDHHTINRLVNTTFVFFLFVSALLLLVILSIKNVLVVDLLNIPLPLQSQAALIITLMVGILAFNLLFSFYKAILTGLQRYDITNSVTMISQLFRTLGIFLFLHYGFGLIGLIVNNAIFSFLTIGAYFLLTKKFFKQYTFSPLSFRLYELKRILKFSTSIILVTIAGMFLDPFNKLMLTRFVSLASVAYFEVASRIQNMVRNLFNSSLDPLLPVSSELDSQGDMSRLNQMYTMIVRFLFVFVLPFFIIIILLSPPFIRLWLGEEYTIMVGRAIQILLVAQFVSLAVTPAFVIMQGIGKPHLSAIGALSSGVMNIAFSIPLSIRFGYWGAVGGIAASLILGAFVVIFLFYGTMSFSWLDLFRYFPWKAVIIVSGLAALFSSVTKSIPWNLPYLIMSGGMFIGVYTGCVLTLKVLDGGERQLLYSFINGGFFRGKIFKLKD